MSREVDMEGKLSKEDIVYLSNRDELPDDLLERIDPENLRQVVAGEVPVDKLKVYSNKAARDKAVGGEEEEEEAPTPEGT